MKKAMKHITAAIVALAVVGSGIALAHGTGEKPNAVSPQNVPGMMAPGGMMGPGMMYQNHMGPNGTGQGMMMGMGNAPCQGTARTSDLSADDVKTYLDGHLKWMGHKRLEVGNVTPNEDGSLLVDVNTLDGSLAWKMEVDPKTGAMHMAAE